MSDADTNGFGKFVPGFDFLQNLAKGASVGVPQMPSLGAWVAPTMDMEELDKRIGELKNVQFWLEQNSRALAATVQALEVQKMTLSTLKGMNFNLGDLANTFNPKTAAGAAPTKEAAVPPQPAAKPAAKTTAKTAAKKAAAKSATAAGAAAAPGMVDPLQLWGSLTQQFQQIAATAMQEVSAQTAAAAKKSAAKATAKSAPRKRT